MQIYVIIATVVVFLTLDLLIHAFLSLWHSRCQDNANYLQTLANFMHQHESYLQEELKAMKAMRGAVSHDTSGASAEREDFEAEA